ncbi:hypothetical protein PSTG_16530 [Puccinia striiformis f. sp. tritici PST-78]|uniref:Restriction of telomere capping protein 4 n=1 Tax=Puccinia striiformis f. sp. tritici PST-78 TaxID=1165861 RepID=A0A0L0USG8_9BASI|nr:hypothetical protein PSTG_16530 [Puccinia striiformis f. sp. tritici PST-78]
MGKGKLLRKMLSFEFAFHEVAPPKKTCPRSKKEKHRIPAELAASRQTTSKSPSSSLLPSINATAGQCKVAPGDSINEQLSAMPAKEQMQAELKIRGMNFCSRDQESVIHAAFRVNDSLSDIAEPEMDEQVSEDPEGLCRFCNKVLPQPPSAKLVALGLLLARRGDITQRYSWVNPLALHLPFPFTAGYCGQHKDESEVIPMGIKHGWPTQIDFSKLSKRAKGLADHLWAVVHHYGYQGFQLIYQQLIQMFLKSTLDTVTRLAHPLDPEYLLRKVLMPEAALSLIGEDMSLPMNHPELVSDQCDSPIEFAMACV